MLLPCVKCLKGFSLILRWNPSHFSKAYCDPLTQRTRIWANSGSQWRAGKPSVLQSTGLERVGHNWATEPQPLWPTLSGWPHLPWSPCFSSWSGPSSPLQIPHSLSLECSSWLFSWLTPILLSSHNLNTTASKGTPLSKSSPMPPTYLSLVIYSHATRLFSFLGNTLIWNKNT